MKKYYEVIKSKYPLSYAKLINFVSAELFELRDLYDFFDKNGLFIFVECSFYKNSKGIYLEWKFEIHNKYEKLFQTIYKYKNRKQAEKLAFKKSFELLEGVLNENPICKNI